MSHYITVLNDVSDRPAWLKARAHDITGSRIPGIMTTSPYSSPLSVYGDIVHGEMQRDTPSMKHGRETEATILAETNAILQGMIVNPWPVYLRSAKWPVAGYSPDGIIVKDKELGLWEAKTANPFNRKDWLQNGELIIPEYYFDQVQWGLFVTGFEWGILSVKFGSEPTQIINFQKSLTRQITLYMTAKKFVEENLIPKIAPAETDIDRKKKEKDEPIAVDAITIPMTGELMQIIDAANLGEEKASTILRKIGQYWTMASQWQNDVKTVIVTDASQTDIMTRARELRLKIKPRRIELQKECKALKESALREGQAIDKIRRTIEAMIEPMEDHLQAQEDFVKIQEKKQREALAGKRKAELIALGADVAIYDLGNMTEGQYIVILQAERDRKSAQERAEADRIDREIKEKLEAERIRKENENLRAEAAKRDRVAAAEKAKQDAALASERKANEEKLSAERKEREKAEAELRAKQEAERLAEIEAQEKKKREESAADGEWLRMIVERMEEIYQLVDKRKVGSQDNIDRARHIIRAAICRIREMNPANGQRICEIKEVL